MATEILVVAGEASGDLHASQVVGELRRQRPELRFFGMGGNHLAAERADLLFSASEISVMGFTDVAPRLRRILSVLRQLKKAAARRRPSAAILVDVPDFNLRLAPALKQLGIPVAYYISPMVWAWRQGRIGLLQDSIDRMLCILPFEEEFLLQRGVNARYVGHPLLDQLPNPGTAVHFRQQLGLPQGRPTLALLPGSRGSEIRRTAGPLLAAARRIAQAKPGLQIVIPAAPHVDREALRAQARQAGLDVTVVEGRAAEVVGASDVAVVTSGTATLEAALMGRPLVMVYRTSALNALIARAWIRLPHYSLVNILAGRRIIPELVQGAMTPEAIAREALAIWEGERREATLSALADLRAQLGPPGAAKRAAGSVLELLDGA